MLVLLFIVLSIFSVSLSAQCVYDVTFPSVSGFDKQGETVKGLRQPILETDIANRYYVDGLISSSWFFQEASSALSGVIQEKSYKNIDELKHLIFANPTGNNAFVNTYFSDIGSSVAAVNIGLQKFLKIYDNGLPTRLEYRYSDNQNMPDTASNWSDSIDVDSNRFTSRFIRAGYFSLSENILTLMENVDGNTVNDITISGLFQVASDDSQPILSFEGSTISTEEGGLYLDALQTISFLDANLQSPASISFGNVLIDGVNANIKTVSPAGSNLNFNSLLPMLFSGMTIKEVDVALLGLTDQIEISGSEINALAGSLIFNANAATDSFLFGMGDLIQIQQVEIEELNLNAGAVFSSPNQTLKILSQDNSLKGSMYQLKALVLGDISFEQLPRIENLNSSSDFHFSMNEFHVNNSSEITFPDKVMISSITLTDSPPKITSRFLNFLSLNKTFDLQGNSIKGVSVLNIGHTYDGFHLESGRLHVHAGFPLKITLPPSVTLDFEYSVLKNVSALKADNNYEIKDSEITLISPPNNTFELSSTSLDLGGATLSNVQDSSDPLSVITKGAIGSLLRNIPMNRFKTAEKNVDMDGFKIKNIRPTETINSGDLVSNEAIDASFFKSSKQFVFMRIKSFGKGIMPPPNNMGAEPAQFDPIFIDSVGFKETFSYNNQLFNPSIAGKNVFYASYASGMDLIGQAFDGQGWVGNQALGIALVLANCSHALGQTCTVGPFAGLQRSRHVGQNIAGGVGASIKRSHVQDASGLTATGFFRAEGGFNFTVGIRKSAYGGNGYNRDCGFPTGISNAPSWRGREKPILGDTYNGELIRNNKYRGCKDDSSGTLSFIRPRVFILCLTCVMQ